MHCSLISESCTYSENNQNKSVTIINASTILMPARDNNYFEGKSNYSMMIVLNPTESGVYDGVEEF
jgi:hypothetical protein